MMGHTRLVLAVTAAIVAATTTEVSTRPERQDLATTTAPDLRLEWLAERAAPIVPAPSAGANTTRSEIEIPPIQGRAGETVRLKYRIRNVGSTDAFAVVIRVQTGLGAGGRTTRVQPGPAAGKAIERTLDLPLAVGLAEVCIGAVLQTVRSDDPRDPFTEDNRICRRANVRPADRKTRNPKPVQVDMP